MSTFSGISTALSALYAQRKALDVTGQNIANANTDGYSRQRVEMSSVGGSIRPALYAVSDGLGNGVTVDRIARVRDEFLESRAEIEHARSAQLNGQEQVLARVEDLFGEPSDTGLQSQLSDYWAAWGDVVNQPQDLAARAQLLQRGGTVTDALRTTHAGLSSLWDTTRDQLDTLASEINTAATAVADLNEAIVRATAAGLPANELADKRDAHVLRLAELAGATSQAQPNGAVNVTLAGGSLVSGSTARSVVPAGGASMTAVKADAVANKVILSWTDSVPAAEIGITSGGAASTLTSLNDVMPGYARRLDDVAARLASTVNGAHDDGYDLNGDPGQAFFTGTTAATISVALTDPAHVAASSQPPRPDPKDSTKTIPSLDAGNADALADFAGSPNGADRLYRTVVTDLGVDSQNAQRRVAIQNVITGNNDAQRAGQSGVSLDEEMANMLLYQRAYQAASTMVSTINSTFDSLFGMIRG
ncbi:flagellar hook-associated protein FlgK [Spirillospora albida]|uniref:flagellar hook-associated protein FlgK n=1 Tax=Spirillospora albida TaxID=58123 RepID=UPI00068FCC0D|nr:flagellar hook-associated protein FlgK [Spirillospora albida]